MVHMVCCLVNILQGIPDDQLVSEYGFCCSPGDNEETCIVFTLAEIETILEKYYLIPYKAVQLLAFDLQLDLPNDKKSNYMFRMYQNGKNEVNDCKNYTGITGGFSGGNIYLKAP